jgi:hypothetical protein
MMNWESCVVIGPISPFTWVSFLPWALCAQACQAHKEVSFVKTFVLESQYSYRKNFPIGVVRIPYFIDWTAQARVFGIPAARSPFGANDVKIID